MPASRRPPPVPVVTLSVGDGEPSQDRRALTERRRSSPSLSPTAFVAGERAPFAWLLACDDASEVLLGPDWAW